MKTCGDCKKTECPKVGKESIAACKDLQQQASGRKSEGALQESAKRIYD